MTTAFGAACRGVVGSLVGLTWFGLVTADPLTLSGAVTNAGTFSIAQLQALGSVAESVGGVDYLGVSLWSLLGGTASGASNIVTSGGGNNPILRNYLLATGIDGSRSLVSIGEIDPLFGGTGVPYLVAYERNGTMLTAPELIVPLDPTGTRNVEDLVSLSVLGAPRPAVGPGGVTSQFMLGVVSAPGTLDLADLLALPATTDHNVTFFNGTNPNGPHDYTGVTLWSLVSDPDTDDVLSSFVLTTGSDGYQVLFALAEIDPFLGAPSDLVAYSMDEGLPGSSLGSSGFFRIVVPGDLRGGRYVSNLASIQVAAAPEPPMLTLIGLTLLGVVLVERQRSAARS